MKERIRRIIEYLLENPMVWLNGISRNTGIPKSTLKRILDYLVRIGIVDFDGKYFYISSFLGSIMRNIMDKYDIDFLLDKKSVRILTLLIEPQTLVDIVVGSGLSEKTVRRVLGRLMEMGIVRKFDGLYELTSESTIRVFFRVIRSNLWSVDKRINIRWAKGLVRLVEVPRNIKIDGSLTAFSVFDKYGVPVEFPNDFYVIPKESLSLEDIVIHSIILADDPYKMTLVAVFIAKNYDVLDIEKLKEKAIKYRVLDKLVKIDAYIHGAEPANMSLLPFEEFENLAKEYNIEISKFLVRTFSEDFLEDLGEKIDEPLTIFLIGGAVMVIRKLKGRTKDIDIVALNRDDMQRLVHALAFMKYEKVSGDHYEIHMEHKKLPKVDLYVEGIPRKFILTRNMIERAERKIYGKLTVLLPSNEDLILIKMIAGRMRDILDIERILRKTTIDWRVVIDEMLRQEELLGKHYCLSILGIIEQIEKDLGIKIRAKRRLVTITLEHMVEYAYFVLGKRTIKELRELLDFPEATLRRVLKRVLKRKGQIESS